MASRKEQKAKLRAEREAREAAEQEAARRKRMVGIGVGGVAAVAVVVVAVALLAGGGGGGGGNASASSDVLPSGGSVPKRQIEDLTPSARKAGCTMRDYKGKSREHLASETIKVKYDSKPPTEGKHYQVPANDGAYEQAPPLTSLVHALEHGRIIIWFKRSLPKEQRAGLKALFDDDSYQMILTPDNSGMTSQVAASAWSRNPAPLGTGHLLACPRMNDGVYDALRNFKDRWRGNGPEVVP